MSSSVTFDHPRSRNASATPRPLVSETSRSLDQSPSLVTRRIFEGRTAGAAAQRLRFLAGAGDCVHLGADRSRVARRPAEGRRNYDRAFGNMAVAIGVAELFQRPFDDLA